MLHPFPSGVRRSCPGEHFRDCRGFPVVCTLCSLWIAAARRNGAAPRGPIITAFPLGPRAASGLLLPSPSQVSGRAWPPLRSLCFPQRREWPAGCYLNFKNCLAFPSPPGRRPGCLFPGVGLGICCGLQTFPIGLLCREMCQAHMLMYVHALNCLYGNTDIGCSL